VALSLEVAKAGPDPEVALEATYGWYWAADLLESDGARVHLVHPPGSDRHGSLPNQEFVDRIPRLVRRVLMVLPRRSQGPCGWHTGAVPASYRNTVFVAHKCL
jgi:hypothetical protein